MTTLKTNCKWIPGYENAYSVTSEGEIVSHKYGKEKILKRTFMKNKNLYICNLSIEGKSSMIYIHRVVAQAFVPNPNKFSFVGFKDGNAGNINHLNLFWH